jgi:hypothetical protein
MFGKPNLSIDDSNRTKRMRHAPKTYKSGIISNSDLIVQNKKMPNTKSMI